MYALRMSVINKEATYLLILQQNGIKSLHHIGNPLNQKKRCSNIPGRLRQSPAAQLAQELNSIPDNRDKCSG